MWGEERGVEGGLFYWEGIEKDGRDERGGGGRKEWVCVRGGSMASD